MKNEVDQLLLKITSFKKIREAQDPSIFNYQTEAKPNEHCELLIPEQSSSEFLSIAKEDSFGNTFESIEIRTNFNESSKDLFSIKNEEPKAKNVYDYNLKNEI